LTEHGLQSPWALPLVVVLVVAEGFFGIWLFSYGVTNDSEFLMCFGIIFAGHFAGRFLMGDVYVLKIPTRKLHPATDRQDHTQNNGQTPHGPKLRKFDK
jgi:hypothetical protein